MKKYQIISALAGVFLGIGLAQADYYISGGFGEAFNGGSSRNSITGMKKGYKDSNIYSLAGGYELPLPLLDVRGEVEYLRTRPEVKDGRTKQLDGLFLNAYGDIPLIPVVDPYVGLGVGRVRYDHSNAFAFQGMLGVEYELPFAPVTVGGEYRYLKINEDTGKARAGSKYHANVLMLKLRYAF